MHDHTEIRLGEYGSTSLTTAHLTPRDVDRLRALQRHRCLDLEQNPTGWRLKAHATVGVLVLDRVRLIIEPKFAIAGDRLMDWLTYALGAPAPLPVAARRWDTSPDGLADLVATALLTECERLLHDGLRREYVRRQALASAVRGSLDVTAQVTRRYGQLDKLHVRTFDRETDTWDNRVLGTALRVARTLVTGPQLARDLHSAAQEFPHSPSLASVLRALDRTRYTRLNARYRAAHIWARLLLRGGGVTDLLADRGVVADGLLLAMPALWEAVVRRMFIDAAGSQGWRPVSVTEAKGVTVRGDLGASSTFRPDLVLGSPGRDPAPRRLLPVDAKYKRYDRSGVGSTDVHQLLTYSTGYGPKDDPRAVIVHPRTGGGHSQRTLQINGHHGPLGSIHVIGLDTQVPPQQAAAHAASVVPLLHP
ncbi:McrC family protein [Streptomyces sp. WAC06273]|uniref:McrC family protein n=1 Tax=Streptomyces sp. WAC06273 TaxID=2487422 RepID=UPI000F73A08F|nr:PE-PGRS family protein [Streptomyces sp. WAC06273]RSS71230.1 PE-PGRS family protein [Streptomyces sp. WAC06273]